MFDFDMSTRRPDMRLINRPALERTLESLRHLDQFHTATVASHQTMLAAHDTRLAMPTEQWHELVARFLETHRLDFGLRGPLPGDPTRGSRWCWHIDEI